MMACLGEYENFCFDHESIVHIGVFNGIDISRGYPKGYQSKPEFVQEMINAGLNPQEIR